MWKEIVKAKGFADVKFDDKSMYKIAQEIAKDLNLVGEDNYEKRFEVSMDDFDIDIEVSNVEQKVFDNRRPSETFAIRVKPEGQIDLYDNEIDKVVKTFTGEEIVIDLDGSRPESMKISGGAFLFTTTYQLGDYDDGKIIVYVDI